ncbi:MAG TPA: hypothetical protein VL022_10160 [Moheibacter sp.]|nr:hypothetical protein [Moheibacter sp.]
MNYIIPNPQALGAVPAGADYLVFTEDVVLPFGWTSSLTETGIMIKDAMGQEIYLYENPHSTDAESHALREENTIFETLQIGNTLTIKTKVKTEWLLNNERMFPVMVDPTATVYPNESNFWTGSVYADGTKSGNFIRFGRWTHATNPNLAPNVRGWTKFNINSVPQNIIVNNVKVNFYIEGGSSNYSPLNGHSLYFTQMLIDPVTASVSDIWYTIPVSGYIPGVTSAINSIGWKSHTLTSSQLTIDINNQKPLGWFALGLMPDGNFSAGQYLQVSNHTSDNIPYLVIDYSFKLTVSGAYTGASYPNGDNVPPANGPVNITPGTRPGFVCTGWDGGTGDIPPTGTATSFNISGGLTQSSSINWLWELQPGSPANVIFHNYGGDEQLAFNNSRINTTTPTFRLSHATDPATDYQIEINTSPNFGGTSWTQTFTGTYPLDTEENFTFTNGFTPTNETTYYVRARVRGEANVLSAWTTETYSFTYQSEQEIPSWFQTTQAQFESDIYSGLSVNSTNGGEVVPMSGGNVITNGSFEDGLTGWSTFQNWHTYVAEQDDYWSSSGSNSLLMWNTEPGTFGYTTGDHVGVSQIVDLTNVSNLEMEANYESASGNVQLRVYIAETTNPTDTNGQLVHTWTPPTGNNSTNINIDLTPYSFIGNKALKLIYYIYNGGYSDNFRYLNVDNVRAFSSSSGTITSTPIHLASVQDTEGYLGLRWNQTLNDGGEMTLKVQQSADGETGWTDVLGYTDISAEGDGEQYFDLELMEAYPHIRLVAELDGDGVTLHDWAIDIPEDCEITTTWNGSSWSHGYPTESPLKKVIFIGDYTPVATDFPSLFACAVDVQGTAQVILPNGFNFIVENEVKVASGAKLTVKDGANLVQINDDAVNEGEITVEKLFTFSSEREQYNFVMSPVEGQDIKQIFGTGNTIPFALVYDEKTDYFVVPNSYTEKRAYGIKEVSGSGATSMTAKYKGEISNGVFNFSLEKQGQGYNFIGNPYPSNIDLTKLYLQNPGQIGSTILFWDNRNNTLFEQQGSEYQGDHYAILNLSAGTGNPAPCKEEEDGGYSLPGGCDKIPNEFTSAGTGFIVQALSPNSVLAFKNDIRTTGSPNAVFFGKTTDGTNNLEKDRYWLTLRTPAKISVINAVVYFEGGNNGFDVDDSETNGSSDELYTLVDKNQLIIQGKAPFVINDTITLGYRAFETGEYEIDIFQQEGVFANGQNIYLIDQDLDIIHNLSEGAYHFRTEAGEFNDRFVIVYEEDEVLSTIDFANGDIQVYRQDKITVIRSLHQDLSELKIFNLNGQLLLYEDRLSGKYYHLPEGRLGKQVLLLNAKTADGKVHSFKILTH